MKDENKKEYPCDLRPSTGKNGLLPVDGRRSARMRIDPVQDHGERRMNDRRVLHVNPAGFNTGRIDYRTITLSAKCIAVTISSIFVVSPTRFLAVSA